MYRYLVFVWQKDDFAAKTRVRALSQRLQSSSSEWSLALDESTMTVLHANPQHGRSRAYILTNGAGVIVGRLFPNKLARGEIPTDPDLDARVSEEVLRDRGHYLIQRYWGRYVGFLHDATRDEHYVLRDPSGGMPCFFRDWGNVRVFFADMQDMVRLGLGPLEVNWNYMTAFLCNNHLQIADTGLTGVSQLLAGEQLTTNAKGLSRRFLWNPIQIAESATIDDFDYACEMVESTAKICIGAWSSIYDTVLHRLSGGLDSAVVLSCIAQAPKRPNVICQNAFFSNAPESDERVLARIAATRAGFRLIETELRSEASRLDRLLVAPATTSPSLGLFSFLHDHVASLAEEFAVEAFFTGQGGDHIFYRFHDSVIAADYARRFGLGAEFFKIVLDTARLLGSSFWSVLRAALQHGVLRRSFDAYTLFLGQKMFLTEQALRSIKGHYHMHPWFVEAAHLPPGKMVHVLAIVELQHFQEPSNYGRVADAPLVLASQPLVELCLKVPTYVLTRSGVDRAVERRAFVRDLPSEIVQRHAKGATTRFFSDMLTMNLPFLRELLLDGALVRQGVLDRVRLERVLARDSIVHLNDMGSLLDCVTAEAWLHQWRGVQQQAAA